MTICVSTHGGRATREEHIAYMRRAEVAVLEHGASPSVAARALADELGIKPRQAFRYVKAVRARFASDLASMPGATLEETIASLESRAAASIQGDEPDWKASAKFTELACRLRGWLDKRSTVTVTGSLTVAHTHALDGASDAEIAALQAYHAARALREASGAEAGVVDSTAEELPDRTPEAAPASDRDV